MKQIIPFTKDITFKNTIGDLVSISLDNDLQLKGEDLITGNFYVKGKYKLTKASIQEEEYSYKIPCEIAISDDYDTFDATIDIDDFYYDIIDNEVLRINIDLVIDNLVKKEVKEKEEVSVRKEEQEIKEKEESEKTDDLNIVFNYDEDIIELGEKADRLQRQKLSNDECNSICASLQVVNSINSVIDNKEELLKQDLKRLQDEYTGDIKTEIFGEIKDDYTVVKKLNNKQHRENKRNIYSILRINSQTTIEDYRNTIEDYARLLNESYNKIVAITDFPVYYLKSKETKENDYIIADINPDNIINIAQSGDTIVKRNIRKDEHIIYASNIIFYDNYNKTLPVGMNVSTLVIIKDEEKKQKCSNINIVEENDEFSIKIKKLNIIELE